MKFFKPKRSKTIHKNRQATGEHDIETYLPFYTDLASLRPVDYRMSPAMINLKENLDANVKEILDQTGLDDLNSGEFYDQHIDHIVEIACDELCRQREDHMHIITEIRSIETTRLDEIELIRKALETRLGIKEVKINEQTEANL